MGKVRRRKRKAAPPAFPLRAILKRKGLSQYRCAQMTGLSQQRVSQLCTGARRPSWGVMMHILTSIGANLGDLAPQGGAA